MEGWKSLSPGALHWYASSGALHRQFLFYLADAASLTGSPVQRLLSSPTYSHSEYTLKEARARARTHTHTQAQTHTCKLFHCARTSQFCQYRNSSLVAAKSLLCKSLNLHILYSKSSGESWSSGESAHAAVVTRRPGMNGCMITTLLAEIILV